MANNETTATTVVTTNTTNDTTLTTTQSFNSSVPSTTAAILDDYTTTDGLHNLTSTLMTTMMTMATTTNDTMADEYVNPVHEKLRTFNKILLPVLMVIIMTSIGCLVTIKGLKDALRRPVGIAIGFAGQFVVLPLLAFCMALALNMEAPHALGMMMVATSPGGVSSSLFVYWMNGNICLSLCMSTVATLASVGMMPLNLFIYSRYWEAAQISIPYKDIALALALILIPVVIGVVIRYKKEEWTPYIIKTGSILGLIAIIVNIIVNAIINDAIFRADWPVWFCSVGLPFFSFFLAYLLAWALRQDHTNCRTIAVETSSQNVALTLAIIGVTFADQELESLVVYPSLYSLFLTLDGLLLVPMYWLGRRYVLPRLPWYKPKGAGGKGGQKDEQALEGQLEGGESGGDDVGNDLFLEVPPFNRGQSTDSTLTTTTQA